MMQKALWENGQLRIVREESEIPWYKLFTRYPYREMSDAPYALRMEIYRLLDLIERELRTYYHPAKINIASFGNYLPQLHWHIMARFAEDSYFPEPMWGAKQRDAKLSLPSSLCFEKHLRERLEEVMH